MNLTYIYTLSDNTGIRYVGKSNNPYKRLRDHKKECKKRRTHKEKWLYSLFESGCEIKLEILEEISNDNWCEAETYWISQLTAWGFRLVNGTRGGEGSNGFEGKRHSIETKQKCSEAARKLVLTDEMRNKISQSNRNRILSKESKERMSKKAKLRIRNLSSQETKDKISVSMKEYYKQKQNTML